MSICQEVNPETRRSGVAGNTSREVMGLIDGSVQLPASSGALSLSRSRGVTSFEGLGTVLNDEGNPAEANSDTSIRLGCIIKPLVALVTLLLCERGELDPSVKLGEVLRELRATHAGDEISIDDLLTHRTGLIGVTLGSASVRERWTWMDLIEFVRRAEPIVPPGTAYSYMHTEYALLAGIIERVTGSSLETLVAELILAPLSLDQIDVSGKHRCDMVPGARFDSRVGQFVVSRPLAVIRGVERCRGRMVVPFIGLNSDIGRSVCSRQFVGKSANFGRAGANWRDSRLYVHRASAIAANGILHAWTFYERLAFGHNSSTSGVAAAIRHDRARAQSLALVVTPNVAEVRDNYLRKRLGGDDLVESSGDVPDLESWIGNYIGVSGLVLAVVEHRREIALSIGPVDRGMIRPLTIKWWPIGGRWRLKSNDAPAAVAFFVEPITGSRCVMFGMSLFRRVAEVG